ncbi:MAG: hypothetical protein GX442_13460 [Candidatus Riflebacteria bacterium]|nr:hypothetical protein [Candidatus Riflebacteria bacterium]
MIDPRWISGLRCMNQVRVSETQKTLGNPGKNGETTVSAVDAGNSAVQNETGAGRPTGAVLFTKGA